MTRLWRNGFTVQSLAIGGVAWGMLWLAGLSVMDALMLGWCLHVAAHAAWCWWHLATATPERMRERARALAEGRRTTLALALLAAAVAAGTVVTELVMQKDAATWERILAVLTIILSWLHVHLTFAVEYAHEYWLADSGLGFPGGDGTPAFGEFVYVAMTVGTTTQVSDTPTNTPAMRRLVLIHAMVGFAFNAVILAATVNVMAGLAG